MGNYFDVSVGEWVGGSTEKRRFDVSRGTIGMDGFPKKTRDYHGKWKTKAIQSKCFIFN